VNRHSAWPDNFALPAEMGVAHVGWLSFGAPEVGTPPFSLNHVATTGLWTLLRRSRHRSLRGFRCFRFALSLLSFFGERKCMNCCLLLLRFGLSLEVVNGLEMGAELNLAWAYKAMSFLAHDTIPLWFCFAWSMNLSLATNAPAKVFVLGKSLVGELHTIDSENLRRHQKSNVSL